MKIKMLSTQNGSLDGIRIASYQAGSVYDLSDSPGAISLAKAFLGARMAIEVPPDPPATPAQEQPATAGFFMPVVGTRPDDAEPGEQIDGQGLEPCKAIEASPENKMLKRAYTRKAK